MEIISAFIIGIAGSLHCVGMCGPLVLAVPFPAQHGFKFYMGRILYNIGRVCAYAVIGFIIGIAGRGIALAGFQQAVSIILGLSILVYFVLPSKYKGRLANFILINKTISLVKSGIGKLFGKRTLSSMFLIGVLNGFLPCGFVYIAAAGALAAGSAFQGMLFMILFGAGTIPSMFALSLFGKLINNGLRLKLRKAVPVFAVIFAVLFILRGMNLGIPYISPAITQTSSAHMAGGHCH